MLMKENKPLNMAEIVREVRTEEVKRKEKNKIIAKKVSEKIKNTWR